MTTNYHNSFISVASDCPATSPQVPPINEEKPTVAALQYQLLTSRPYQMTSDELLFTVYATRTKIPAKQLEGERERFFSKDQACLRASPLSKRYGWGTHHNAEGRVALYGIGTTDYEKFANDPDLVQKAAMRSARAS